MIGSGSDEAGGRRATGPSDRAPDRIEPVGGPIRRWAAVPNHLETRLFTVAGIRLFTSFGEGGVPGGNGVRPRTRRWRRFEGGRADVGDGEGMGQRTAGRGAASGPRGSRRRTGTGATTLRRRRPARREARPGATGGRSLEREDARERPARSPSRVEVAANVASPGERVVHRAGRDRYRVRASVVGSNSRRTFPRGATSRCPRSRWHGVRIPTIHLDSRVDGSFGVRRGRRVPWTLPFVPSPVDVRALWDEPEGYGHPRVARAL